ncbi:arginase family protein [archaeon]|nr:arginase family protein [archaeon]
MKIINIPIVNGLSKTKGVEEAPAEILARLESIYSNGKGNLVNVNNLEVSSIGISGDLEKDNENIYRRAFELFGNEKLLFLGGDHSLSYPLTRAFFDYSEHNSRKPCLIVFDAHPDCMEPVDRKIPTHEEWLKALIEDGFPTKNILLVGSRNADVSELNYLKEKKIKQFTVEQLMFELETKTDAIMEFGYGKDVYVSIDIDAVDPAYAPGTGYCEVGGISSQQFLYIVKRLSKMKNLKAVDLVEINPKKDVNGMTLQLGAKIVSEFL